MAKRYTDTLKWTKRWYRELGSALRDVRQYVLDTCSHYGVWEVDLDTLKHFTGQRVSLADISKAFQGKMLAIDSDKIFIPAFIDFQYGELSEDSRPHQSVIRELRREGLWDFYQEFLKSNSDRSHNLSEGLANPYDEAKDKDKEQDKDKAKDNALKFDFDSAYASYPRHEGKAAGIKSLEDQIRSQEAFDDFSKAVFHYAALMERRQTEPKHIKQFSSFVGTKRSGFPWREYIDRPKELDQVSAKTSENAPPSIQSEIAHIRTAIKSFGAHRGSEARDWLGEVRWEWVKVLGGWPYLCQMPSNQFTDAAVMKVIREQTGASA